jgi:hypothetical protein
VLLKIVLGCLMMLSASEIGAGDINPENFMYGVKCKDQKISALVIRSYGMGKIELPIPDADMCAGQPDTIEAPPVQKHEDPPEVLNPNFRI